MTTLRHAPGLDIEGFSAWVISEGYVVGQDALYECESCGALVRREATLLHIEYHTDNDKFTEIVESLQRMTRT